LIGINNNCGIGKGVLAGADIPGAIYGEGVLRVQHVSHDQRKTKKQ